MKCKQLVKPKRLQHTTRHLCKVTRLQRLDRLACSCRFLCVCVYVCIKCSHHTDIAINSRAWRRHSADWGLEKVLDMHEPPGDFQRKWKPWIRGLSLVLKSHPRQFFCVLHKLPAHSVRSIGHNTSVWPVFAGMRQNTTRTLVFYILCLCFAIPAVW